jgi:anti-anti-sigma regulatory factor
LFDKAGKVEQHGEEITSELSGNKAETLLTLAGECGHAAVETLQTHAMRALSSGKDVLIDSSEAAHIHASVAQVLLALSVAAQGAGRKARISPGGEAVRLALESAGMGKFFFDNKAKTKRIITDKPY